MATVIKRQIRTTPHRTAGAVWQLIAELIAPARDSKARAELSSVAGVLAQVIASEATKNSPIVVFGSGPRVRFYCLYDEDAITGEDANENSLPFTATEGDWRISVATLADDLKWVQQELKGRSERITAREVGEPIEEGEEPTDTDSASLEVDTKAFFRS
jgi:hypothetical protein